MTRAEIDDEISNIRSQCLQQPSGDRVERAMSNLADRAVAEAWSLEPSDGWTALAVGGYGRRTLHPGSDLDILFFSEAPRRDAAWLESMVRRLVEIPFPAEADAALESDFTGMDAGRAFIYGAYLDARFLFGARDLARRFTERVVPTFVDRHRFRLIHAMVAMREATVSVREAQGSRVGGDGPGFDLKNGRGGLADYRWIGWMGRLGSGFLVTEAEAARASDAARFLRSVRTALHWTAAGGDDILDEARAGEVARAMGIVGSGSTPPLLAECRAMSETIAGVADAAAARASAS